MLALRSKWLGRSLVWLPALAALVWSTGCGGGDSESDGSGQTGGTGNEEAGASGKGGSNASGTGGNAAFSNITGLAIDTANHILYASEGQRVRRIRLATQQP